MGACTCMVRALDGDASEVGAGGMLGRASRPHAFKHATSGQKWHLHVAQLRQAVARAGTLCSLLWTCRAMLLPALNKPSTCCLSGMNISQSRNATAMSTASTCGFPVCLQVGRTRATQRRGLELKTSTPGKLGNQAKGGPEAANFPSPQD